MTGAGRVKPADLSNALRSIRSELGAQERVCDSYADALERNRLAVVRRTRV